MTAKSRIISLIVAISVVLAWSAPKNWQFDFTITSGRSQNFTIGMNDSATDRFDRQFDMPAPPATMAPPHGFYPYISFVDTNYRYLDAAWKDIRAPHDSALWKIILHYPDTLTTITWEPKKLPVGGKILIEGIDASLLGGKYVVPQGDTIVEIKYISASKYRPQGGKVIRFNLKEPARVHALVYSAGWKMVDDVDFGSLVPGEYKKVWKPKSSGEFFYQVFAGDKLIAAGPLYVGNE